MRSSIRVIPSIIILFAATSVYSQETENDLRKWILNVQMKNGAFVVHTDPGVISNNTAYYQVQPYFVNVALKCLLSSTDDQRIQVQQLPAVKRWIDWYLEHRLDEKTGRTGVVLNHWYTRGATNETTKHPGGNKDFDDHCDADDSVAATFLDLVATYISKGGDANEISTEKQQLREVFATIEALTDEDGLTWAKSSWRVKYLMDNCETRSGLEAMLMLEQKVFMKDEISPQKIQELESRLVKINKGIESFFDNSTQLYSFAKHANGAYEPIDQNLAKWYPMTIAQVWPVLFEVTTSKSERCQNIQLLINQYWEAGDRNWSTRVVGGPLPSPSMGCAAAMVNGEANTERAKKQYNTILRHFKNKKPYVISDVGWMLKLKHELNK